MEERLLATLEEFGLLLKEDARVTRLKSIEERLIMDEEVQSLSRAKDEAEALYSEAVSLGDETLQAKRQKELYEAKLALDSHPLSQEYTEAFVAVRDLYREIDDILFGPYRKKVISGKGVK